VSGKHENIIQNKISKIRSKVKKTKYNTKSAANSKCKCAPDLCIHVSFACNQQLAHCRETTSGSEMQSGKLVTRTENQKQSSKTEHNTKSAANSKYKCAHVLCIHVSFACNQQLAHLQVIKRGSAMQSGAFETRTEH
jgi:hypothetical protein